MLPSCCAALLDRCPSDLQAMSLSLCLQIVSCCGISRCGKLLLSFFCLLCHVIPVLSVLQCFLHCHVLYVLSAVCNALCIVTTFLSQLYDLNQLNGIAEAD